MIDANHNSVMIDGVSLSKFETSEGHLFGGFDCMTGELILLQWEDSVMLGHWIARLGSRLCPGSPGQFGKVSTWLNAIFRDGVMKSPDFSWGLPEDTALRLSVWHILERLDSPVTYGEVARLAGNRRAVRSVATAVGMNPLQIVLPCHLVVPSGKKITGGYAAGEDRKRRLLELYVGNQLPPGQSGIT